LWTGEQQDGPITRHGGNGDFFFAVELTGPSTSVSDSRSAKMGAVLVVGSVRDDVRPDLFGGKPRADTEPLIESAGFVRGRRRRWLRWSRAEAGVGRRGRPIVLDGRLEDAHRATPLRREPAEEAQFDHLGLPRVDAAASKRLVDNAGTSSYRQATRRWRRRGTLDGATALLPVGARSRRDVNIMRAAIAGLRAVAPLDAGRVDHPHQASWAASAVGWRCAPPIRRRYDVASRRGSSERAARRLERRIGASSRAASRIMMAA
jgi:hypothetical protein